MSTRFYLPDLTHHGRLVLEADQAKHLTRVCRLGVGDVVEVFDGKGHATRAEVVRVNQASVELTAIGLPIVGPVPPLSLTLASAVPKGERFDWLIEKATELGIERLIPLVTDRSIVEPGGVKLERLRKTIVEASKQCGRNQLMILDPPMRWQQLAAQVSYSLRLLADPEGAPPDRWPAIPPHRSVILVIGPEGGFTPAETAMAAHGGWAAIRLASTILRIETAGLAGCAALFSRSEHQSPE